MKLILIGHDFKYEAENIIRLFFPLEKITAQTSADGCDGDFVLTSIDSERVSCTVSVGDFQGSRSMPRGDGSEDELNAAYLIYALLSECTGYSPKWGLLTGVRPSKLLLSLGTSRSEEYAAQYFKKKLLVSDEKLRLAQRVISAEREFIALSRDSSYSLYIAVPFCPTRCAYCSFVSHSVAQAKKLIPEYMRLLCEELELISRIAAELSLSLETVYIGGGTPTCIDAQSLSLLLETVKKLFPLSAAREYTVEAGRPDTLTNEKLLLLKSGGVTRISINPQTFSDEVLKLAGRRHTSRQTLDAFAMAREAGFDNINMDFIAGLEGETAESFGRGIDKACELSPENITVHTLALKRAAQLSSQAGRRLSGSDVDEMLAYADVRLTESGYHPYYMYRQSKSLGNNENVGWARNKTDCLYNIYMMEEIHTVLSAGAGAVTKLVEPRGGKIERVFNFKYPYEYIERFSALMLRKDAIYSFYGNIFDLKG